MDACELLDALAVDPELAGRLVHREVLPARSARYADLERDHAHTLAVTREAFDLVGETPATELVGKLEASLPGAASVLSGATLGEATHDALTVHASQPDRSGPLSSSRIP